MSEIIEKAGGEERNRQGSLRDLYYVFFRHKWKMVLFFLTVTIIVAVGTFLAAEIYRSEAKLLVRVGRESVSLDPTATTGQIINVSQSREDEINSELEIIKSRGLAEKVVDSIGPAAFLNRPDEQLTAEGAARETVRKARREVRTAIRGPRSLLEQLDLVDPIDDRTKAVLTVMNNLKIDVSKNSNIISIFYEAQTRELARDVIAKLIDLYLEKHIAVHQTPGSYEFFAQQSNDLRNKLVNAEKELLDVKNMMGISSPEEQRLIVLNRIGNLEQQTGVAEAELAVSKAKVQTMQKTLAGIPEAVATGETAGFSDHGADLMRARLYELQMKEQSLESKYTEESRQVQMIRQEVAEAQALLDKEKVNSIHKQVQLELFTEQVTLSSLEAKVENLKGQLADAQAELKTVNDADFRITQLTREIDVQKANYRKYSDSLEQGRIDQALEVGNISNISVVQSATLPMKSVRPKKKLNLALGVLLGIFGAIGLAFSSEYIDHSIRTPEEVEDKLQLPTLVSIPYISGYSLSRDEKINGCRRAIETLKEQILLRSQGSQELRVFAITSPHRNEGVSVVAANLAATLARLGQGDALLIDANLGHPSVHETFNTDLSPGLADALANNRTNLLPKVTDLANSRSNGDAILSSPARNLHVLSAGETEENLSEILESDKFRKLLDSMKKNHRFVVVDLPAVSEASWAARLARLCDGVGLVVEAERLRWEVVNRAKEQLLNSKANILGVVLNKRRFHIPGWLYRRL